MVTDAFQGLTRSRDILGHRVGVDGVCEDIEKKNLFGIERQINYASLW